jgi:hypothetical protein
MTPRSEALPIEAHAPSASAGPPASRLRSTSGGVVHRPRLKTLPATERKSCGASSIVALAGGDLPDRLHELYPPSSIPRPAAASASLWRVSNSRTWTSFSGRPFQRTAALGLAGVRILQEACERGAACRIGQVRVTLRERQPHRPSRSRLRNRFRHRNGSQRSGARPGWHAGAARLTGGQIVIRSRPPGHVDLRAR